MTRAFADLVREILVCPACRGALRPELFDDTPRLESGLLRCGACASWYPVTRGVPVLLEPGAARTERSDLRAAWGARVPADGPADGPVAATPDAEGSRQVESAFSYKWGRLGSWGFGGGTAAFMEEWMMRKYGWGDAAGLAASLRGRACVLDAGCGLGRETLRMAACTEGLVVGMDLCESVHRAADHARERGAANVLFIRADLMAPPFPPGLFGYILSEGVLHHTPDTRRALASAAGLLAPGGEIAFYVYRKKALLREYADDAIRARVSGLPPAEAWRMMEPLTRLARSLHEVRATVELEEDVRVLDLPAGRHDLQRLVYDHLFKCFWNDAMSFDENVLINFDWYYPRYAWRQTEEEVRSWLAAEGLELLHEHVEVSGITVRARRR